MGLPQHNLFYDSSTRKNKNKYWQVRAAFCFGIGAKFFSATIMLPHQFGGNWRDDMSVIRG